MDVRSIFAEQKYNASLKIASPAEGTGASPIETFEGAYNKLEATLKNAESVAMDNMVGKSDPHVLVEALAQSELAVETAVAIRNKVVEAYQEILRMPV